MPAPFATPSQPRMDILQCRACQAILETLTSDPSCLFFLDCPLISLPNDEIKTEYLRIIPKPLHFGSITAAISGTSATTSFSYVPTITTPLEFNAAMLQLFHNAKLFCKDRFNKVFTAAVAMEAKFVAIWSGASVGLINRSTARSTSYCSSGQKLKFDNLNPRSAVGIFGQACIASNTTLIIVPPPLLPQWAQQISMHIDLAVLPGGVWIDEDESRALPDPHLLASMDIVVISLKRLANQWKFGRPEHANRRVNVTSRVQRPQRQIKPSRKTLENFIGGYANYTTSRDEMDVIFNESRDAEEKQISSLLQVAFSDVALDEGHDAGRSSSTDAMLMAESLTTQNRWLLTGTPTPSNPQQQVSYH